MHNPPHPISKQRAFPIEPPDSSHPLKHITKNGIKGLLYTPEDPFRTHNMRIITFVLFLLVNIVLTCAQSTDQPDNCTQFGYVIFEGPAVYGGIIFRGQPSGPVVIETMAGGLVFSTPSDGPLPYHGSSPLFLG